MSELHVRVLPRVRDLAKELSVDITKVTPESSTGVITEGDVYRESGRQFKEENDVQTDEPNETVEKLSAVYRAMDKHMSRAHKEVVPVTITDDVDINGWLESGGYTLRVIRSIVEGCRAAPRANSWYDSKEKTLKIFKKVDLGVAVHTKHGLYVPVIRDAGSLSDDNLSHTLKTFRERAEARQFKLEDLQNPTITITNVGMIAGKHVTPIVVPPAVVILGVGRVYKVVCADSPTYFSEHNFIPLSLTFDHRCLAGGEAAEFLAAVMADLEKET